MDSSAQCIRFEGPASAESATIYFKRAFSNIFSWISAKRSDWPPHHHAVAPPLEGKACASQSIAGPRLCLPNRSHATNPKRSPWVPSPTTLAVALSPGSSRRWRPPSSPRRVRELFPLFLSLNLWHCTFLVVLPLCAAVGARVPACWSSLTYLLHLHGVAGLGILGCTRLSPPLPIAGRQSVPDGRPS